MFESDQWGVACETLCKDDGDVQCENILNNLHEVRRSIANVNYSTGPPTESEHRSKYSERECSSNQTHNRQK